MPDSPEPDSVASRSGSHRLHAIECARGAACAAVVLFHSLTAIPAELLHPALRAVRGITQAGGLGVNVFFAVSGWCIAERLAAARRRRESAGAFLRERALRIYPAYWAALAALLAVRLVSAPFNTTRFAANFPAGVTAWVGDIFLLQPYLNTATTLAISWSLIYEMGFYMLCAGALFLRNRSIATPILLLGGLLLVVPALTGWESRYTHVLGLWPDFFVGVLAWRAARPAFDPAARLSAGAVAALLALTIFLGGQFGGIGRFVAIFNAALLWLAARREARHPRGRAKPLRALAWLGGISYSLYLIHVTVLSPFTNLSMRFVPPHRLAFVGVWLAALGLAVGAGWALHHWVEAPVERWRKNRGRSRLGLPHAS